MRETGAAAFQTLPAGSVIAGIAITRHEAVFMLCNVSPACHFACTRTVHQAAFDAAIPYADIGPYHAAATPNLRTVELGATEGEIKGRGTSPRGKPVCTVSVRP